MPTFEYQGRTYHSHVELALEKIGGRWKLPILWRLKDGTRRYGELRKMIQGITPKMLTQQLRELELDGFIERTQYPEVPPRVEYNISERGRLVLPVILELRKLGETLAPPSK